MIFSFFEQANGPRRPGPSPNVWPLFDAGKPQVLISAAFPLACAAQAHALMESDAPVGKIVPHVR